MSPSPFLDCEGCFLRERTGGVCPMAREMVRARSPQAQHRAEALHAAILQDAGTMPSFTELVRRDAVSHTGALSAAVRLLLAAPVAVDAPGPRKEAKVRVLIPSRASR
jgi:hypothetical protein